MRLGPRRSWWANLQCEELQKDGLQSLESRSKASDRIPNVTNIILKVIWAEWFGLLLMSFSKGCPLSGQCRLTMQKPTLATISSSLRINPLSKAIDAVQHQEHVSHTALKPLQQCSQSQPGTPSLWSKNEAVLPHQHSRGHSGESLKCSLGHQKPELPC